VDEPRPGTNRARNRGVGISRAPVIVCCDADDEVAPGWLRAMVGALDRDDLVGAALDPDPLNGPDAPYQGVLQRTALPTAFGMPWSVGAALGFRRAVFDALGGFDEAFVLGSDETDFCIRAHHAGFSIGFARDAVVRYRLKESARGLIRQRFLYGRGHERLVRKHAALGTVRSSPRQRWKTVVVGAGRLVRASPAVLRRETRLQYVASGGYLAGRVVELVVTRPYSWRLDRSTSGRWKAR
jgi:GT2 family glycosyltransferase